MGNPEKKIKRYMEHDEQIYHTYSWSPRRTDFQKSGKKHYPKI